MEQIKNMQLIKYVYVIEFYNNNELNPTSTPAMNSNSQIIIMSIIIIMRPIWINVE